MAKASASVTKCVSLNGAHKEALEGSRRVPPRSLGFFERAPSGQCDAARARRARRVH